MKIEAVKVTAKKSSTGKPESLTESLDKDINLAKAWLGFRNDTVKFFDEVTTVSVDLQFESSYDEKTHHSFNADEAVFVSDIKVCPKGNVVFVVPYGAKDKTFHYAEAELINVVMEDEEKQLNSVINGIFRKNFAEFSDIPSITMLERKYLAPNPALAAVFNDAEEYIKSIEVKKDRLDLYSKIKDFGIF